MIDQILTTGISETDGRSKGEVSHQSKQNEHPANDEFDMFAQSRNASYETTKNRLNERLIIKIN